METMFGNLNESNDSNKFETNLSEADIERLAILIEEAAEVQQLACKILRHGWGSYNPFDENKTSNRRLLEKELGDLWFAVELMIGYSDLNRHSIEMFKNQKTEKIKPYLHFNI